MSIIANKKIAALIVKAGLQHMIRDPQPEEIKALAEASDQVFMERTAYLVKSLQNPSEALRPFDGGIAARAEVKALAYLMSGGN